MSQNVLVRLHQTYVLYRQLTFDALNGLEESELSRSWPRPGLDTFAKHLAEMAAVEGVFVEALTSGRVDFSSVPDVFEFENVSKDTLRSALKEADTRLENAVNGSTAKGVSWGEGELLTIEQHFASIIAHEVFHQGMMAMAFYFLRLPLPESWVVNWAMPQVEPSSEVVG
ncbi:MAG TPA: DinB family protein [Nitrospira sp.]